MRLLLDGSFPEHAVSRLSRPGWEVGYMLGGDISDAEAVEDAATQDAHAVVFLGRQALGRAEVWDVASRTHVILVAVDTYNPIDATEYLGRNLGRLRRRIHDGVAGLLVGSEGVANAEDVPDVKILADSRQRIKTEKAH